jgi:xanthine dehydrogenase accessory factor
MARVTRPERIFQLRLNLLFDNRDGRGVKPAHHRPPVPDNSTAGPGRSSSPRGASSNVYDRSGGELPRRRSPRFGYDAGMNDFLDKVAALAREGRSFVTATVVARRPPVSAHLGDRAIVYPDGRMEGFVGGACSREIIRKQALDALGARHARLVSIRPDATDVDSAGAEHVVVPMTCVSEGAIDVYVEPHLPRRLLVVAGATPVADALARTATALSFDVVRVVEPEERRDLESSTAAAGNTVAALDTLADVLAKAPDDTAVVVASQGHYDEAAIEASLHSRARYVGLVASRKRGGALLQLLKQSGVPRVDEVRCPAGLDLGARTAPEVALSILAEIVKQRPAEALPTAAAGPARSAAPALTAVDPVCGMSVDIATAKHTADVGGTRFYFCCPACRSRFVQDPAAYGA